MNYYPLIFNKMNATIQNQFTKSKELPWNPLIEKGVTRKGVFVKVLRYDEETQRPPSFLLKFEAGASYPNHNHPAGEEVFVLEGEVKFNGDHLYAGDYLYTAPGQKHAVFSKTGCTMLFMVPEEVEIL
jgi:quercetin dioxygenase-like cupin family protein